MENKVIDKQNYNGVEKNIKKHNVNLENYFFESSKYNIESNVDFSKWNDEYKFQIQRANEIYKDAYDALLLDCLKKDYTFENEFELLNYLQTSKLIKNPKVSGLFLTFIQHRKSNLTFNNIVNGLNNEEICQTLYYAIKFYLNNHDYKKAIKIYQRFKICQKPSESMFFRLALILLKDKSTSLSTTKNATPLRKIEQLYKQFRPKLSKEALNEIVCLIFKGYCNPQFTKSEKCYQYYEENELILTKENRIFCLQKLGKIMMKSCKYKKAYKFFYQALEINPFNFNLMLNIIIVKNHKPSLEALLSSKPLKNNNEIKYILELAETYNRLGLIEEYNEFLKEAIYYQKEATYKKLGKLRTGFFVLGILTSITTLTLQCLDMKIGFTMFIGVIIVFLSAFITNKCGKSFLGMFLLRIIVVGILLTLIFLLPDIVINSNIIKIK